MPARAAAQGPDAFADDNTRPRSATTARRHRPSTKAGPAFDASARRTKPSKSKPRRSKKGLKENAARMAEDKREASEEMITDAKPKNLIGEKDQKKNKGKSTHALEAHTPSKRPSRKSTRRGANHIKPDSQQRRQNTRAVRSAKNRHAMASG